MAVTEALIARPPPLQESEGGVLRVGDSRVTLETVMWHFNQGRSPEEIRRRFPTLRLDDLYAVIAYYTWNREEIEAYLARAEREADEVQRECEARWPSEGIRERLQARRQENGYC